MGIENVQKSKTDRIFQKEKKEEMTSNMEMTNNLNEKLLELLNSFAGKVSHPELLYVLMIYVCESAQISNPEKPLELINETAKNAMKLMKQLEEVRKH